MANLGFALLISVTLFSLIASAGSFYLLIKNKIKAVELAGLIKNFSLVLLALALLCQASLIYSFIVSDYQVLNVYQNSHHLKPLIYKIAGSWGNHEGSMLLLISILCGYLLAFGLISKANNREKILTFSVHTLVVFLFGSYTALVSNPFLKNPNIVDEGLGLNPILQDIGLALHPPMLYLGYIGVSIIFSYMLAALINESVNKNFAKNLKIWAHIAFAFLTIGIALGSWWAYRELGWGGYWFWDPVENVSLMPWLAVVTLIHCLQILEKKEIFKIWSANLAILSFLMSLLGIFLVRSGVLTSVHSFAIDAQRGFFVILLLLIIGAFGFLILAKKWHYLENTNSKIKLKSQIGFILANNYFLTIALFVVVLGTLYPIFSRGLFDKFIAIGPTYYNQIFAVLLVPFLLFLALNYYFFDKNKQKLMILAFFSSICVVFLGSLMVKVNILAILLLFLAILMVFYGISCLKSANLSMNLAHIGFSLIICGIIFTSYLSTQKQLNAKIGDKITLGKYDVIFEEVFYQKNKNFISRVGKFSVNKNGKKIGYLEPKLNYYQVSDQTTNEAAISHFFWGDLYLVIGQKDDKNNYAFRGYFKAFIWLIWLGASLIVIGVFIRIYHLILGSKFSSSLNKFLNLNLK